ncbi:hypothetical protein FC89_GL001492 [Liquorilactobacillus ghanensis DSM 18630]|uniref:CAAX prenyl protease 2/Lysostaphin resistance protein A-like domain-containing protein n=1 Tax=Liquorilactobacillus ghanensis DSM 18630 TaxID=1423750 RepID=A0A0R1VKG6_9LACO|nr:CPBP family intramembrane glutamic endopeptidase [Liquorilactobacillus ghanensis]KRM05781.1 hypothetical protein FC89_GL001492 [Liquorilactobacillus ghanensis DSM 18630]
MHFFKKNFFNKLNMSIIILFLFLFLNSILSTVVSTSSYLYNIFSIIIYALLVLLIIITIGKGGTKLSQTTFLTLRSRLYILPCLIYTLVIVALSGAINNIHIVLGYKIFNALIMLLLGISIGLFEEFYCRGLLFNLALSYLPSTKHHLLLTSFISSVIFSLLHLLNLSSGQDFNATLQQSLIAFSLGFSFAAMRVAFNGIVIPIIIHSLIDIQPNINGNMVANEWKTICLIFLPLLLLDVLCLNHYDKKLQKVSVD